MNTVMVTGGAGYVGSVLVRDLLHDGFRVVCVDDLRFGGQSLLGVWGHPHFELKRIDMTHRADLEEALGSTSYSAVVHLAAIVGDPACALDPGLAVRTNRDASMHLLERVVKLGIPRFVFASTCSNYGKMQNDRPYVDETSPLAPVSLYAELKVEFERAILEGLGRSDAFTPTVLRFATVYGISPRMRFDLTVNEFTKEFALGREVVVYGEQFWRPYCHVSDFSRAIRAVLKARPETVGYNVFNVGDTAENYTKRMIMDELLRQVPEGRVSYVRKEDDLRDYRVAFEKIRKVLDFKISRTVPQGIREIRECLAAGIIENPDAPTYYNVPHKVT